MPVFQLQHFVDPTGDFVRRIWRHLAPGYAVPHLHPPGGSI